jgi:hypothetical protein
MEQLCLTKNTLNQRRSKSLHLRVSAAELDFLTKVAHEKGYKLSGLIREALQSFLGQK